MTPTQISATVARLISEHQKATPRLEVCAFTDDAELVSDLGFDSLDSIELAMALEGEFDLEISNADAESNRTVGQITAYLVKRLGVEEPVAA